MLSAVSMQTRGRRLIHARYAAIACAHSTRHVSWRRRCATLAETRDAASLPIIAGGGRHAGCAQSMIANVQANEAHDNWPFKPSAWARASTSPKHSSVFLRARRGAKRRTAALIGGLWLRRQEWRSCAPLVEGVQVSGFHRDSVVYAAAYRRKKEARALATMPILAREYESSSGDVSSHAPSAPCTWTWRLPTKRRFAPRRLG